jgi:anti-anti-sigma factor
VGKPAGCAGRLVVALPVYIDITNAEGVGNRLAEAAVSARGSGVVVADLGGTRFCDVAGVRHLLTAGRRAAVSGVDLRLAAACGPVLRLLRLTGADQLMRVYPSVPAALADGGPAGAVG